MLAVPNSDFTRSSPGHQLRRPSEISRPGPSTTRRLDRIAYEAGKDQLKRRGVHEYESIRCQEHRIGQFPKFRDATIWMVLGIENGGGGGPNRLGLRQPA